MPGCEITNIFLSVIPANYINGGLESGYPVITGQPRDTVVTEGKYAIFNIASPNATGYSWKESRNNGLSWNILQDGGIYAGTHTSQLKINQVTLAYNGTIYNCDAAWKNCITESNPAKLNVDSLMGIGNYSLSDLCLSQNKPNPFITTTTIEYCLPENGYVRINIFDKLGRQVSSLVNTVQSKGNHAVTFDSKELPCGAYFYNLEFKENIMTLVGYRKMIKISY
jgi:hypothetical protein